MAYWDEKEAGADRLRLFVPSRGWVASSDKTDEEGKVEERGARELIDSAFLNALNSTNLLILTGAGASFSATNPDGGPSAPGMRDLWNAVKEATGENFDKVTEVFKNAKVNENIERLLTVAKLYLELNEEIADHEGAESADGAQYKLVADFVLTAEKAILQKVDFVSPVTNLTAHSGIIQRLAKRGIQRTRTRLFTTNYDLCFEEAAKRHRFTLIDGFSHSLEQVYDRSHFSHDIVHRSADSDGPDFIDNVLHLYKLHGSSDWRRVGNEIVRSSGEDGEPVLIYPRSSKYQESFEAPYLDMLGALQSALAKPDTAIIISGFGFNDDHISRPILAAMESNLRIRLIICDPIFVENAALESNEHAIADTYTTDNRFLKAFSHLARTGDTRIHLLNGRFQDLAMALPDIVGETDRERHAQRVRDLHIAQGAG